jgi:hypothetical protein
MKVVKQGNNDILIHRHHVEHKNKIEYKLKSACKIGQLKSKIFIFVHEIDLAECSSERHRHGMSSD